MNKVPIFSKRAWFKNISLSRKDITYINRIRTGHYQLNSHLHRMKIVGSPSCECCNVPQNIDHIVWQCPLLSADREELIFNLAKELITPGTNVTEIFLESSIDILMMILYFLYNNEVFFVNKRQQKI